MFYCHEVLQYNDLLNICLKANYELFRNYTKHIKYQLDIYMYLYYIHILVKIFQFYDQLLLIYVFVQY